MSEYFTLSAGELELCRSIGVDEPQALWDLFCDCLRAVRLAGEPLDFERLTNRSLELYHERYSHSAIEGDQNDE